MQGRKCSLLGNKNRQFTKVYIRLSANQLHKRISTHNTTIKIKSNEKNYPKYKQATKLSKLTNNLKNEYKNYKICLNYKKILTSKNDMQFMLKKTILILESDTN